MYVLKIFFFIKSIKWKNNLIMEIIIIFFDLIFHQYFFVVVVVIVYEFHWKKISKFAYIFFSLIGCVGIWMIMIEKKKYYTQHIDIIIGICLIYRHPLSLIRNDMIKKIVLPGMQLYYLYKEMYLYVRVFILVDHIYGYLLYG